jgi:hypothetical protein
MSMLDYGAIVLKNGKLVNDELATPMIDMVGWEDSEDDYYHEYVTNKNYAEKTPIRLKDEYFAYIGDSECTVSFYKTVIAIVERIEDHHFTKHVEYLGNSYYTWRKWEKVAGGAFLTVTQRNGYLVCKWKYKGDKYKVYFGYGVDVDFYKKWHMINYYRSPIFELKHLKWWFEDKMEDWKRR